MFNFFKKKPIYIGVSIDCTPDDAVTETVNKSFERFKAEYDSDILRRIFDCTYDPKEIVHDECGFIFHHEPSEDDMALISVEVLRGSIDEFRVPGYIPTHISFYKLLKPLKKDVEGWIDWDTFKKTIDG